MISRCSTLVEKCENSESRVTLSIILFVKKAKSCVTSFHSYVLLCVGVSHNLLGSVSMSSKVQYRQFYITELTYWTFIM